MSEQALSKKKKKRQFSSFLDPTNRPLGIFLFSLVRLSNRCRFLRIKERRRVQKRENGKNAINEAVTRKLLMSTHRRVIIKPTYLGTYTRTWKHAA